MNILTESIEVPEKYKNAHASQKARVKIYTKDITAIGQEVYFSKANSGADIDFDATIEYVYGIEIMSNNTEQARERGFFSFKLNEKYVYEESSMVPAKELISGEECPPDARLKNLGIKLEKSKWEAKFKDVDNLYLPFQAYQVILKILVFDNI